MPGAESKLDKCKLLFGSCPIGAQEMFGDWAACWSYLSCDFTVVWREDQGRR